MLGVVFHKAGHLQPIARELSTKERVDEEDVADDVDEVEKFTEKHPDSPVVVGVKTLKEVLGQDLQGLLYMLPRSVRVPCVCQPSPRHVI